MHELWSILAVPFNALAWLIALITDHWQAAAILGAALALGLLGGGRR